jgi:hypothetical protein
MAGHREEGGVAGLERLETEQKAQTRLKQSPFTIVILSSERRFYRRATARVNNEKHKPLEKSKCQCRWATGPKKSE